MIQAGRLKDKISLSKVDIVQNDSGGNEFTETEYLNTFAEVLEIKSDPTVLANQENVKQAVKVTIRYRETIIENGDILKWRGFSFVVNNFVVDLFRTSIEMICIFTANSTKRTSS